MKFLLILLMSVSSLAGFSAASFTADKNAGCPPLVVNFTDHSNISPTSWLWDFNNGNTSTLQNPSAAFLGSGLYKVKLIVSNGTETDTVIRTITVFNVPVVDFSVNAPNSCLHDTLKFTSNITLGDAPITQYAWGFGNGVANSTPAAHYLYNQTGSYSITLVVQDSNGCSANLSRPNYVHVFAPPVAAFTASPTSVCATTQLVTFTNHSVGGGLTYFWQLDNGVTSTNVNPTYTYNNEVANAVLTVTDSVGCKSTASQKITVETLAADFTVSKQNPCTGEKITFINSSNIQGNSWFWDFGDGVTTTSSSSTHAYLNPGIYTVKFVVSAGNCRDSVAKVAYITVKQGFTVSTATFSADSTRSCGQPLNTTFTNTTSVPPGCTYHWEFGNGDTSNLQHPTEPYTIPGDYTVELVITDSNGCIITGTQAGMIQTAKPVAKFAVDSTVCFGSGLSFHNQSTNAQEFTWIFGDGDTSYLSSPSHQYAAPGSYNVTLIAYNEAGCDTSITKVGAVRVTPVHVDFRVNSTFSPCPPFVCLLTNQSDIRVNKLLWDFGDGYTDTAANPTHIYFYPGVYTVKLIGRTPQGCIDTAVYPDLITVQGPTGQFSVTPTTGCVPLNVTITASPSSNTESLWCDFGDGAIVHDTAHLVHIYNSVRVFHPKFVLTDFVGCTVSYPLDSIITRPVPTLNVSDTSVCSGTTVSISAASDVSQILWSPSTLLNCASCNTVTLTPVDSMVYDVTVTNQYACTATSTVHVNAVPIPVLNDSVSARLCAQDSKVLFAGNANKVVWSPGLYLSDSTTAAPVCTPLASINYTVTASNSLGCSVTAQVPVMVKDKVSVTLPGDAKACAEGQVQLTTSAIFISDLGASYAWSNPQYLNDPTSPDPIASPGNHSREFSVTVSSGHCIPDTQNIAVEVVANPDLEVSSAVRTTPFADVPLYAASHQQLTYQWTAQDSLSCSDCRRTNLFPTKSQIVYVTGTNSTGCTVKDSVLIDVVGCDANSIFLPNTFTPNGDGLNDKFYIRTSALSSLKYFRIFDEWGNLVFETNHLDEGWDGNVNGKHAAQAVYVYILEGKCQDGYDVMKTGNVTAIR